MSSAESMSERTILEKRANYLIRSFYSWGGHLILTNRRLVFKPHPFNIRSREISIELGDIVDIGKIDGMVGLSKQIRVKSRTGRTERLVVWKRAELINAVKSRITDP